MYKVLIVEDEDIIRKGLMFMMDWFKVNCVVVGEAIDGVDGLNKVKKHKPDIVITDVKMPFKDGIQMLEESIFEYGYEAIIVSGYSEFEYAKKAITLGVTEYLLKPIDFEYLYKTIKKLTDKIESKNKIKRYLQTINTIKPLDILNMQYYDSQYYKTKYVIKMLNYIKNHYKDKIRLTDLSKDFKISAAYLNAKFKEETSYTFNDFLNRYRIIQALELLKADDMKIYEIAEEVGFKDYKYFIEVFKKYTGYSPTKFFYMNNSRL